MAALLNADRCDCDRDSLHGRCGADAVVVFGIGNEEVFRCAEHAADIRKVLRQTVMAEHWSETSIRTTDGVPFQNPLPKLRDASAASPPPKQLLPSLSIARRSRGSL